MQFQALFDCLQEQGMSEWQSQLEKQIENYFSNVKHGDYPKWQQALDELPSITPSKINFNDDAVVIGDEADIDDVTKDQLIDTLKTFLPWRKGPFDLFGVNIDTEWRSDLKWNRLKKHINPLENKLVLDIGCGNGYYAWRMLGQGAKYIVGIDPTLLFYMQFQAIKKYQPNAAIDVLPFAVQDLPEDALCFDTVFSMGVIYHRRDPDEHLQQLKRFLNEGGELVLETLVLDSDEDTMLEPNGRYAKMNNVHAIPSLTRLTNWVTDAGFRNINIIDVSKTSIDEQRCTKWMQFESLEDFLDQDDHSKTIEGHPAPVRAVLIADK